MHRLALFIFSPIIGLISIFNQSDLKVIRFGVWIFITIYCFNIDVTLIEPFDIYRYVENVGELYNSIDVFDASIIFLTDENNLDFISPLITVISVFIGFGNGRFFLLLAGILFGYFYSSNVIQLYSKIVRNKPNYITVILFIITINIVPISSFNGYRFWTATHIFINALLPYLLEKKKPKFFLLALSLFTHFAFAVPIFAFALIYSLSNYISSRTVFLCLSLSWLILDGRSDVTKVNFTKSEAKDLLPSFVYNRIQYYVKKDVSEVKKSTTKKIIPSRGNEVQLNGYVFFPRKVELFILRSMIISAIFIVFFNNLKLDFKLINASLIFLILALFLKSQSSGARYMSVSLLLAFITYSSEIDFYKRMPFFWNKFIQFIVSLPILWYTIIKIRLISDFIGITGLFGNVIIKIFFPEEYRIIDFAKIFLPSL